MKKLLKAAALLALVTVIFVGCAGSGESAQPEEGTVEYSNLTEEVSRNLLEEALEEAGVQEERIQSLMTRVDRFNAGVKAEWLTKGFEKAPETTW